MAIETDSPFENAFSQEFVSVLAALIEAGTYSGDWEFQLAIWLPQYCDIVCKYRGYKVDVKERRILLAGERPAKAERPIATVNDLEQVVINHQSPEPD
jgi:hypothetical protein